MRAQLYCQPRIWRAAPGVSGRRNANKANCGEKKKARADFLRKSTLWPEFVAEGEGAEPASAGVFHRPGTFPKSLRYKQLLSARVRDYPLPFTRTRYRMWGEMWGGIGRDSK